MHKRIYIETTIPSSYYTLRTDSESLIRQRLTRQWWDEGDALHLAITSLHKVDILLTWNCMHLANPNKFNFIARINRELGLTTPELKTPLDYLGGTK